MSEKFQDASSEILKIDTTNKSRESAILEALKLASNDLFISSDELDALNEKF
jgi:hypothetical protein